MLGKRIRNIEFEDIPLERKPFKNFREEETITEPTEQESGQLKNFLKDEKMIKQLKSIGINSLFPIQRACFNAVVKGLDLTAKDKTGSGKTLAYSLPALEKLRREKLVGVDRLPKVLVMLPTRQLALQVKECFCQLVLDGQRMRVVAVYGGDSIGRQLQALESGAEILVATPGRLKDMMERKAVSYKALQCMVLDEADEMLKQGFKQDIEKIFRSVMEEAPKKPQVLLFSATLPEWVRAISERYQKNSMTVDMVGSRTESVPKTIRHLYLEIRRGQDLSEVVKKICLKLSSSSSRCIIFCETKRDVNELNSKMGDRCRMLHGDVKQQDRERIYRDFKSGKVLKVVATNVAARGLDFPQVELVVQVQPPKEIESYVHRAGRTGRAGREGTSVVLVQGRQMDRLRAIERAAGFRFEEMKL